MKPDLKRCIAFQEARKGEDVTGGRNVFSKGTEQRSRRAEQSSIGCVEGRGSQSHGPLGLEEPQCFSVFTFWPIRGL